jgi:hypothetical protein
MTKAPRWVTPLLALAVAGTSAAQNGSPQPAPARDTPAQAQRASVDDSSGRITGRVVAGDTGRPLSGARVVISAPQLARSSATLTDDEGAFEFARLPEGRYTINVTRTGFVGLSWGQRRPLQPGTPIQLSRGQRLSGIDFRLPRGSVIEGRIQDQSGEPMPGVMVRVMRYQYVQGRRELVPGGFGQTDDRGQYRIWGLNPGNYYVTAAAVSQGGRGARRDEVATGAVTFSTPTGAGVPVPNDGGDADGVTYAPTFYPGVSSPLEAQPITLGLSAEANGVDFQLQRVRTSVISGRLIGLDGGPVENGGVLLTLEGQSTRGWNANFGSHSARVRDDGTFSISRVAPGRYLLRAFSGDRRDNGGVSASASQLLALSGEDVTVSLALAPNASLSGTISLKASGAAPDPSQFRVSVVSVDGASVGGTPSTRVAGDGTFTVDGIPPGSHLIRAQGPGGWVLQSAVSGGREIVDTPVQLRSGERLNGVTVTFTEQLSEVSGVVSDVSGTPVPDYTVIAFAVDSRLWHAQSRHIMTARPDQMGRYQLRGLPPGDYYLAVVDPVEAGEWFEPAFLERHRMGAVPVTISPGDARVQDFEIATP